MRGLCTIKISCKFHNLKCTHKQTKLLKKLNKAPKLARSDIAGSVMSHGKYICICPPPEQDLDQ